MKLVWIENFYDFALHNSELFQSGFIHRQRIVNEGKMMFPPAYAYKD